jgi:energy-coupling factor transporter ATP-binding protein EcfA2
MDGGPLITVQVTGPSGCGKSTLARRLAVLGHRTVSADGAPGLCRWVDDHGVPVERPGHPSVDWLAAHRWAWDPGRLDMLIDEARVSGATTFYVCGRADNDDQLSDRFELVVLLDIDEATMIRRVAQAARGNDFGRCGDSLQALISGFTATRARYLGRGAVIVDATADLDTVAASLLQAARW